MTDTTDKTEMTDPILFLRAQTAVHVGAGSSVGAIDLPIQREGTTRWPMAQAGGIKGVLRDAFRRHLIARAEAPAHAEADRHPATVALFGPPVQGGAGDDHAKGSIGPTDARIAAFPLRSVRGVFALIVCPYLLERLADDLALAGRPTPWDDAAIPALGDGEAVGNAAARARLTVRPGANPGGNPGNNAGKTPARLVLEDMPLAWLPERSEAHAAFAAFADWLAAASGCRADRLVLVSDDVFTHYVKYGTEVVTRNRLEYETKRVAGGALFTQEFLPPAAVLYTVLLSDRGVGDLPAVIAKRRLLQIGGDETTGKGWCWANLWGGPAA